MLCISRMLSLQESGSKGRDDHGVPSAAGMSRRTACPGALRE